MDLVKIIQALEELVYEVALWPPLLLRSLIRFFFQPRHIFEYVDSELKKRPHQRNQKYLSPILYWLFVGVVPLFLMFSHTVEASSDPELHRMLRVPVEVRFVAIVIYLIWPPLAFALGEIVMRKEWPNRQNLRQPFYIECMCLAPFYPLFAVIYPKWKVIAAPIRAELMRHASTNVIPDALIFWFRILQAPQLRGLSILMTVSIALLVAVEARLNFVVGHGEEGSHATLVSKYIATALMFAFYYGARAILETWQ